MTSSASHFKYFLYARKSSESEDKQVASIPSQIEELKRLAKELNIKIFEILTEEQTAKAPGRPVFNQMLSDISAGKATGILCWKLDRLARNPIDGGSITWLLQKGVIQHIQTFQRAYCPTDNVIMMSVEFGMANQFILDLSVNTKRGMRNKAQNGWLPHKPPLGYLANKHNLPDKPPIFKDPERFTLVRKLWDMLLEKKYSLDELHIIATDMGLKTVKGNPYPRSSFYLLFRNPFYYGSFLFNDQLYQGKHEPLLTKEEFDLAQRILDGRSSPKEQAHTFAYTGLIRCGECGASITAEEKVKHQKNGNVHRWTYYRCTKRIKRDCSQKPIRSEKLEAQILDIISRINIPASFHEWAIKCLKAEQTKEVLDNSTITQAQRKCLDDCTKRLNNLFDMRVNGEITAEQYNAKKAILTQEQAKYEELLQDTANRQKTWLSRAETLFDFAEKAKERFETGSLTAKRDILSGLGSNLSFLNGILDIPVENDLHLFPEVAAEVRELHNRLEPLQSEAPQEVWEALYTQNEKWGG